MAGTSIGQRLVNLRRDIAETCARCGRDPRSVRLLAVSKLQPIHHIRTAFDCGQSDFAENYVQEAMLKQEQFENAPLHWHFIGRIQSNKVKMIANRFSIIHSVDRYSVALNLNSLTDPTRPQMIFLQYN